MSFSPTAKQREAINGILAGLATWLLLYGGGRSGKTFLIVRTIVLRALKAAGSRHLIVRFRFNALRSSVIADTFPKVMRICFPGVHYVLSKTDWCVKLDNGSEIWFGGLDEGERMEKLLGMEFASIYCNESSQISWAGVMLLLTRLAQKVMQVLPTGTVPLKLRFFFDCNPPSKAHWSFKVFKQKVNPETKEPLPDPDNYQSFQMNPEDNLENLSEEYMKVLDGLSERMKRRFKRGEFAEATPNALFDEVTIDRWRVDGTDDKLPDFVRVVVSVDPSGASDDEANADNDEVGITVDALGTDGRVYLLEDLTVSAGPTTWGKVAVQAFIRHKADVVVGETNFGGGMVKLTIQVAAQALGVRVPFKMVTASRGKMQRAEPFSALYEEGKVRHVGVYPKLEDELCAFSTGGYTGPRSPNRADAHIWALAELFPSVVRAPAPPPAPRPIPSRSHFARK